MWRSTAWPIVGGRRPTVIDTAATMKPRSTSACVAPLRAWHEWTEVMPPMGRPMETVAECAEAQIARIRAQGNLCVGTWSAPPETWCHCLCGDLNRAIALPHEGCCETRAVPWRTNAMAYCWRARPDGRPSSARGQGWHAGRRGLGRGCPRMCCRARGAVVCRRVGPRVDADHTRRSAGVPRARRTRFNRLRLVRARSRLAQWNVPEPRASH